MRNLGHTGRGVGRGQRGRGAFTLVELLVVIGIIAILIAMLLPALSRVQQQARTVQCMSNLRSIGQALMMYANAHKGTLPYGWWGGTGTGNGTHWPLLLQAMMTGRGADWTDATASGANIAKTRTLFHCPEVPSQDLDLNESAVVHYLCHPRLMPQLGQPDSYLQNVRGIAGATRQPYKISRVKRSAEIVIIFDGSLEPAPNGGFKPRFSVPVANALDAFRMFYESYLTDHTWAGMPSYMVGSNSVDLTPQTSGNPALLNTDAVGNDHNARFRHAGNKKMNGLMVDGHVETFEMKSRFTTTLLRKNINVTVP